MSAESNQDDGALRERIAVMWDRETGDVKIILLVSEMIEGKNDALLPGATLGVMGAIKTAQALRAAVDEVLTE